MSAGYDSSAGFEFEVPKPTRRKIDRNFKFTALGSVGIQDSHPGLVVIQALNGPIRSD
jgi:hypothetical protein